MTFTAFLNRLIDEAHERGRKWARTCAAIAMSSEDRDYLEKDAKSMARRLHATPFDPAINGEDKLRADEHDKTLCALDDAEMALTNAVMTVRQREDGLAHLGREAGAPTVSPWLTLGGATLFAGGFAIGIYDFIHDRLPDPYIAALVALVPSVALGVFVVHCLTHPDSPEKRTLGLIAGIGVSLATGVLRYAFAPEEWVVGMALTLLELFIVFFLDWHGRHLQARYQKWANEHEGRTKASELLNVARQQHDRIAEQIAQLKQRVDEHREEVNVRAQTFQKLHEIEAALCNAILAGAHKGIAETQGLRRGVISNNNNSARTVLP